MTDDDWGLLQDLLRASVGKNNYTNWIAPLSYVGSKDGIASFSVPTNFLGNYVSQNFGDLIVYQAQQAGHKIQRVHFSVLKNAPSSVSKPQVSTQPKPAQAPAKTQSATIPDALTSAPLDNRFTFDSFVVGKPNELAHAAARRVAEGGPVTFNPLFLYGGVGLGKTHLMHAIAHELKTTRPDLKVLYLSAEQFMYRFVQALRERKMMDFKSLFRAVDVLMVDDVQFIGGKGSTQEEFFHTFNALVDQNKQIIISADKAPSDLQGLDERLRSRLAWGLVADIHPSTYELRLGILQSKREKLGADVPSSVLEFLALKVTSNIRELEGALNRIVAHADVSKQVITLESTQEVLQDLLRAHDRRITIDEIQRKVAEHYNLRLTDMHSARRARNVARPRQVAMYLSKLLTARSLPEIGRKFGGRDHTTVMHAIRKVEELMGDDAQIAQDVEVVRRALTG